MIMEANLFGATIILLVLNSIMGFAHAEFDPFDENANDRGSYCFRFTWLEPKYTSGKLRNRTCAAVLQKAKLICEQPLITTDNNEPPDTRQLWEQHSTNRSYIACRLSPGDVCVKYSYIYNDAVENITYTCTKVSIENEGPITSGCYSQVTDGHEVQVCVCKSNAGQIPCNAGVRLNVQTILIVFLFFPLFIVPIAHRCGCPVYSVAL